MLQSFGDVYNKEPQKTLFCRRQRYVVFASIRKLHWAKTLFCDINKISKRLFTNINIASHRQTVTFRACFKNNVESKRFSKIIRTNISYIYWHQ